MKKMISGLLVTGGIVLAACHTPDVNAYDSSVRMSIGVTGGACTAVHVGEGYFLSAAHCLVGQTRRSIEGKDFEVLWSNKKYDISLMYSENLAATPSSNLHCRDPIVGENIVVVGEPGGVEDVHTFGKVASNVKKDFHSVWSYVSLLNVVGAPGSSGSPVYDKLGNVIGIVVGGPQPYGGMTAAVPGSAICKLMGKAVESE